MVELYDFYYETLKRTKIEITLKYDGGGKDDRGGKDSETFSIKTLLRLMTKSDKSKQFLDFYDGREFNSSKYKIFDLINDKYEAVYGYKIMNGQIFKLYYK